MQARAQAPGRLGGSAAAGAPRAGAPSLSSLPLSSLLLSAREHAQAPRRRPGAPASAAAPGATGAPRPQRAQAAATEILAAASTAEDALTAKPAAPAPATPPAAAAAAAAAAAPAAPPSAAPDAEGPPAVRSVSSRALPGVAAPQFEPGGCTVFSEEFRVRGNEAGPDQRVDVVTVANLLQEVGGNHGVALWGRADSGFAAMPGMDHLLFVATRMQIRMHHYPKWGDLVRLETWFQEDGRLATRRDWRVTDAASGAELGAATSTWVTINHATRRLSRLPENVRARFLPLSPSPPRHALPAAETRRRLQDDLPAAPDGAAPGDRPSSSAFLPPGPIQIARRSEMDPNGHINNVTYLEWALESAPAELVSPAAAAEGWRLAEVEIDFKAECTAGDRVEACVLELPSPGPQEAPPPTAAPSVARRARAAAAACGAGRREAAKAGRAAAPGRKRALLKQLLLELAGRAGEAAAVAAQAQQEERRAAAAAVVASVNDPAAAAAAAAAAAEEEADEAEAAAGGAEAPPLPARQFLHVLRKHEQGPGGETLAAEVWRARLTWVCDGPAPVTAVE